MPGASSALVKHHSKIPCWGMLDLTRPEEYH